MGNIINDIVEEINIKPNKLKLVIKWTVSIAFTLIGLAFVFGQFKSSFFNRMDSFEDSINKNTEAITDMKAMVSDGFTDVDKRIEKVYDDGFEVFGDYQEFNKKQLLLVLDYGQRNKELIKGMLELNVQEQTRNVENKLEQARNEPIVASTEKNKDDM